ncbi:MAG: PD40 domain-containing protein [Bacteroidales bacterium]|nr:PD40 domain-containing protein [Bacteroidales bacterium]
MKRFLVLIFLMGAVVIVGFSQKPTALQLRKNFTEGYRLFNLHDYQKALPYFFALYKYDTKNANYAYLTGVCLYKTKRYKKAVSFLTQAVKNTTVDYKDFNYSEKKAPLDAYLYLGFADHQIFQFTKALDNYKFYEKTKEDVDTQTVNQYIRSAKYAMKAIGDSIEIAITNLGKNINSKYNDYAPTLSADEKTLIFTSRREGNKGVRTDEGDFFEDIYIAKNENGKWMPAQNIGKAINTEMHEASVSLSPQGDRLFIYKDEGGIGNIYESLFRNNEWTRPVKVSGVNSSSNETHASISADGSTLYFVSDRPGGMGGADIYYCMLLPNGEWSLPQNIGLPINTPYNEDAVIIHPDGNTLYFSSQGHQTIGGYDLFYSNLNDDEKWSQPINFGYPINTPDDERFFIITPDNKRAYFSAIRGDSFGGMDIYMMDFLSLPEKAGTVIKGFVKNSKGQIVKDQTIVAKDESGKEIGKFLPNEEGKYTLILRQNASYTLFLEDDYSQSNRIMVPDKTSFFLTRKILNKETLIQIP